MQAIVEWPILRYFSCVLQGMDSLRHRWKLTSDSSPIAKQHQKPCSGPPPVYQDLSKRHDRSVQFANQAERKFETHFRQFIESVGGPEQVYWRCFADIANRSQSAMRDRNRLFIINPIFRVVKRIRLPTKIAAYLVSIGRLLWLAFLCIQRFSKKYPWTSCFLRHVSHLFQTFLTTLYIRQSQ